MVTRFAWIVTNEVSLVLKEKAPLLLLFGFVSVKEGCPALTAFRVKSESSGD
jgi:hypothetical protein